MEINRHSRGQLLSGLFMIAIGVMFLLDRMDVIEISHIFRNFWPILLIVIGVSKLLERGWRSNGIGGGQ